MFNQRFANLLSEGMLLYRSTFKTAFIVAFIVSIISQVIDNIIPSTLLVKSDTLQIVNPTVLTLYLLALLLVTLFGNSIIQIILNGKREGHQITLALASSIAIQRFLPVIVAGILYFCAVLLGLYLYVIPGVLVAYLLFLYLPGVLFDNLTPIQALRRSYQMVCTKTLLTFLVALLTILILLLPGLLLSVISPPDVSGNGFGIAEMLIVFLQALILPFSNVLVLLAYYAVRPLLADKKNPAE